MIRREFLKKLGLISTLPTVVTLIKTEPKKLSIEEAEKMAETVKQNTNVTSSRLPIDTIQYCRATVIPNAFYYEDI